MKNPDVSPQLKNPSHARWNMKGGLAGSVFLLSLSLLLGFFSNGWVKTIPLAPIIGVYVGVAVGTLLRFRPTLLFASLGIGVVVTSFVITLGGAGISNLWHA